KVYETMPVSLWGACEEALPAVIAPMRQAEVFADAPPEPASTDLVLWQLLCVADQAALLSRDIDFEWIDAAVYQAIGTPGPDGSLHPRSDEESLDAWTYRELCGLHALADLALL